MALAHLAFTLLMCAILEDSEANNNTVLNVKPLLDPKRRSEIVDDAFLEQKDVLLDMLESKLKEVRDKKKKKVERTTNKFSNNVDALATLHDNECENLLKNVDVQLRVNGIGAVGAADIKLKYGNNGKGTISLNSTGISNVGQAQLEMGVGDGAVYIPGLSSLFVDRKLLDCAQRAVAASAIKPRQDATRRSDKDNATNAEGTPKTTTLAPVTESPIVTDSTATPKPSTIPTTSVHPVTPPDAENVTVSSTASTPAPQASSTNVINAV
ncbi:uncharacterized protein LOC142974730 [Anticarsia gemmatalis]|uniref:uncharacterized protein LOC142974730 n=1 Tax=Anticarsia gemmatalis TaxID=129554 RepID=UPI003F76DBA4